MVLLTIWLGVMGLAGTGAAWLFLSRFPEVFFETEDWKATRKGRLARAALVAGLVVSGVVFLVGVGMLAFMRAVPVD